MNAIPKINTLMKPGIITNGGKVTLDPKPSKNYYGSACEYHCPTYNEEICAERGECHLVPKLKARIVCKTKTDKTCQEAMSGQNLDGVFCAVTTSPWDVKAKDIYKASSYFNTPSPGSIQCTNSQCKRNIEEKRLVTILCINAKRSVS